MPKPDDRALAVRFCATLAEDTAGRPMQYRMIAPIMVRARIRGERDQHAAIVYAVEQGWPGRPQACHPAFDVANAFRKPGSKNCMGILRRCSEKPAASTATADCTANERRKVMV